MQKGLHPLILPGGGQEQEGITVVESEELG